MQERFKNLFGIMPAATLPVCYVADASSYTTTETGLYLTDLAETSLERFNQRNDCQPGNLLEAMDKARRFALQELETSLLAGLSANTQQRLQPFTGIIGQGGYRGFSQNTQTQLRLTTKALKGAILVIKRIAYITDTAGTADLSTPDGSIALVGVATGSTPIYHTLPEPLELAIDGTAYTFDAVASGAVAANNVLSCGCSRQDKELPNYFVMQSGSEPANGFVFDIEIKVLADNIIYANAEAKPAIKKVLAWAARYKAAEAFLDHILNSAEISRYTLLDKTHLYGNRSHCRKEYENRVIWLLSKEGLDLTLDSVYLPVKRGIGRRSIG
jgi:hypothetical protein